MTFAFWKKFPQFWSVKSEGLKSHAISLSGLKKIKHFRFQGVTLKYVGGQFRLLIFENQRYDNWFILNNIFIWGGNNRFTFPPQRGRYRVPRCLSWLRIQLCYFCGPDLISGPWTSACFVRLHPPPPQAANTDLCLLSFNYFWYYYYRFSQFGFALDLTNPLQRGLLIYYWRSRRMLNLRLL